MLLYLGIALLPYWIELIFVLFIINLVSLGNSAAAWIGLVVLVSLILSSSILGAPTI